MLDSHELVGNTTAMRRHAHSRQTDRRSFCMESSRLRRRASTSLESFLYLHTHTWYVYPGYKSTWMHFTLLALCTLRKRSIGRGQTYIRANSARPIAYRRERESRHVRMGSTNNQTITPKMHLTKLIYAPTHPLQQLSPPGRRLRRQRILGRTLTHLKVTVRVN